MEKVIEVSDLTKRYGDYTAVNKLNLSISKGEVFGLLGPNGAGKSTTILMLMGLTEPNSGRISVCGINPFRNPIQVKKRVGYLPEDVGFYDDYSGLENLMYTARLNEIPREEVKDKAYQLLEKVGLEEESHKKVGKYSRGMRQRLGFADVLMKNPEVIILDEPTLGIDPGGVKSFLELIVELSRKEKMTVLFSSHNLYQVQQVCDRVGLFVKGDLLAQGNVESLSGQLFSSDNCIIEGEFVLPDPAEKAGSSSPAILHQKFELIEGVSKIEIDDSRFYLESERDVTSSVAKLIISLGFGLSRLNKKVFGLDDIYHRYFQGVEKV